MISDSLNDIPGHPGIKIGYGQVHQLDEKIRDQRNINQCSQVKQYPASKNFHAHSAQKQHDLSKENQVNKIDVLILDSQIYHALCQERENQQQQTSFQ